MKQSFRLAGIALLGLFFSACGKEGDDFTKPSKLPLEYVSEYNVAPDGKTFAKTHDYMDGEQGFFDWNDAMRIDISGWHLPTLEESMAIFPKFLTFTESFEETNVDESISVRGEVVKNYTADYKGRGDGIVYTIKMKGNRNVYRTAYRYQMIGTEGGSDYRLVVQCIYLGAVGKRQSIVDVSKESFWRKPEVERVFPATGGIYINELQGVGRKTAFWTSTEGTKKEESIEYAACMDVKKESLTCGNGRLHKTYWAIPVRLFSND